MRLKDDKPQELFYLNNHIFFVKAPYTIQYRVLFFCLRAFFGANEEEKGPHPSVFFEEFAVILEVDYQ
jgi:hypothetical protein